MRILCAIVLALLSISLFASAFPDSVTTGPYKISFDLGLPKYAYTVVVSDPKEKESLWGDKSTEYVINIKNETGVSRIASMTLTKADIKTFLTPDEMKQSMRYYLPRVELTNIDTSDREIDGKKGAIMSGDLDVSGLEMKIYQASYYPSKDTTAFITSSYPWYEGTLQLLKTIHVEKINATA